MRSGFKPSIMSRSLSDGEDDRNMDTYSNISLQTTQRLTGKEMKKNRRIKGLQRFHLEKEEAKGKRIGISTKKPTVSNKFEILEDLAEDVTEENERYRAKEGKQDEMRQEQKGPMEEEMHSEQVIDEYQEKGDEAEDMEIRDLDL